MLKSRGGGGIGLNERRQDGSVYQVLGTACAKAQRHERDRTIRQTANSPVCLAGASGTKEDP